MKDRLQNATGDTTPEQPTAAMMAGEEDARFQDFNAIDRMPSGPDCGRLISEVSQQILHWAGDRLSSSDRAELRAAWTPIATPSPLVRRVPVDVARRIYRELDAVIFEQAAIIGARVLFALPVLQRVLEWEHEGRTGEENYRRLGKQLARRASPEAKGDLSEKLKPVRREFIEEIKQLCGALRGKFPQKRPPGHDALVAAAIEMIADLNGPYDRLRANLKAFQLFLRADPGILSGAVFVGTPRPTRVVEEFMGHAMRRSPEALRQAASHSVRKK